MDPRVVIRDYMIQKDQRTASLDGRFDGSTGFLMKTQSAGIPARSGATAGSGNAKFCYMKNDGEIVTTTVEMKVLNPFSEPIGSETYITVKVINGTQLVVDAEDCQ